jgi:hypothetical protein
MIYIFDLDGTLALIGHRINYVRPPSDACFTCRGKNRPACPDCAELDVGWKADWRKFYAECAKDEPNWPVICMMQMVLRDGHQVKILSGRSDEVRSLTIAWLSRHTGLLPITVDCMLTMRKSGDYTPDDQLKLDWLRAMPESERYDIAGVFEDRDRMVHMWRQQGLPCFQVASGDF